MDFGIADGPVAMALSQRALELFHSLSTRTERHLSKCLVLLCSGADAFEALEYTEAPRGRGCIAISARRWDVMARRLPQRAASKPRARKKAEITGQGSSSEHVDVAIVGGGIAGLYCCWRLSQSGKRIVLFEASDRLGGRIETWRVDPHVLTTRASSGKMDVPIGALLAENDDLRMGKGPRTLRDFFVAEFGPMRIEPDHQPYLKHLLEELGITPSEGDQEKWSDLVRFPPYQPLHHEVSEFALGCLRIH